MEFKYQSRPVFHLLLRIAKYDLGNIDAFIDLAKKARRSEQKGLEQIATSGGENALGDWLVDDFAQLDDFAFLSAEFAIIGLWRCIELYRGRAMRAALSNGAAKRASKHEKFQEDLLCLEIEERKTHCARSVDELRCLSNAIKHERRVNNKLATFHLWKSKKGNELGDLESHYQRLRPLAERYLEDLTKHLNARFQSRRSD